MKFNFFIPKCPVTYLIAILALSLFPNSTLESKDYRRIISLTPGITEILADIGMATRLVGRTRFCNYPASIKNAAVVGDLNVSLEKILNLQPDLIITQRGFHHKALKKLGEMGLETVEVDLETLHEMYQTYHIFGKLFTKQIRCRNRIKKMKRRLWNLNKKIKKGRRKPRVFTLIARKPLMSPGGNTFLNNLIEICGGENIFRENSGYFLVNRESLLLKNPEIILMVYPIAKGSEQAEANRLALEGVKTTPGGRVVYLNPDSATRPGPRLIDVAEKLFQVINNNDH